MEIEDGVIWVYGIKEGVLAFTDFGIESLIELVKMWRRSYAAQALRSAIMTNMRPTPHAKVKLPDRRVTAPDTHAGAVSLRDSPSCNRHLLATEAVFRTQQKPS